MRTWFLMVPLLLLSACRHGLPERMAVEECRERLLHISSSVPPEAPLRGIALFEKLYLSHADLVSAEELVAAIADDRHKFDGLIIGSETPELHRDKSEATNAVSDGLYLVIMVINVEGGLGLRCKQWYQEVAVDWSESGERTELVVSMLPDQSDWTSVLAGQLLRAVPLGSLRKPNAGEIHLSSRIAAIWSH